ncbi:pheophytinase, chloroplastic [Dorcoceras hygrometricum]|uniref:Pheophytinase, chloroplastic n=1 Tax=Dorcoceras hygrometricum TaxID=472368 RepID=A0A2Z7BGD8_9LAMI|nr:pheophytinase, chloroplastic [Dorcoceras hygrometricum]
MKLVVGKVFSSPFSIPNETRKEFMGLAANGAAPCIFSSPLMACARRQLNPKCSLRSSVSFSSHLMSKNPASVDNSAKVSAASTLVVVPSETDVVSPPPLEVKEIDAKCSTWVWRGYDINYLVYPEADGGNSSAKPTLLLVHGFGASIAHWRRNIPVLAQSHTVYSIDLLGFGASQKPRGFAYSMEVWAELILDFLNEIVQKPTVLLGNSIGSLACVIAASESANSLVKGLVLFNCAGGMNNKAIVDDWRIKLFLPLLWLIDLLLKQRGIATTLFDRIRQGNNLRNILLSAYGNKENVDEDLVEIIRKPAEDEGALDAFISIVTGPPGPNPVQLIPNINLPILVLWGDRDPLTPIDGPVGRYFASLPARLSNVNLYLLEGVGHCPHDDRPDLVHEKLLPWLANLPPS